MKVLNRDGTEKGKKKDPLPEGRPIIIQKTTSIEGVETEMLLKMLIIAEKNFKT